MHCAVKRLWIGLFSACFVASALVCILFPEFLWARNILEYKDTISTSAPLKAANHTLSFVLETAVAPGTTIEITMPPGFEVLATSTFDTRNVELRVDGIKRDSANTESPGIDKVEIFPGTPGMIRYTLEPTSGISAGSRLEFKIGNHTGGALKFEQNYSTSTNSTTTIQADVPPVINASTIGTHEVRLRVFDGGEVANAGLLIAIIEQIGVGPADTTEEIPPFRFNGSPTTTVGGTTLSVEIGLETDELAVCKFSTSSGISYGSMTRRFSNTGMIYHSSIVPVTPNSVQSFYVRCVDDEGNFNIDDYVISFTVNDVPTGQANTVGSTSGDGTGSGNSGTGSGNGGGGQSGQADGQAPLLGGSSGSGGSGGGGGGGRGGDTGNSAGGGFEDTDDVYPSGEGQVTIKGYAFPRSRVTVLVDGKQAGQVNANAAGDYSITIPNIARGVYTFGVYATDVNQIKSTTFSTSFTVTGARTTALSNINISPSIKVTPDPVNAGQIVTISGYSLPSATVTIENEKEGSVASRKTFTGISDATGAWSIPVDTSSFSNGTYKVRARAAQEGGASTNFSAHMRYGVGQSAEKTLNADLNRDGKVNLTDFSILLFWWNTNGGDSNPAADINGDGKVTLTDFSILLFNWTG